MESQQSKSIAVDAVFTSTKGELLDEQTFWESLVEFAESHGMQFSGGILAIPDEDSKIHAG